MFGAAVVGLILYLGANLAYNLQRQGLPTDFSFLERRSGFRIPGADFRSSQPVSEALVAAAKNTLLVAVVGIVLAMIVGVVVGIARLSTNWIVRRSASVYVETLRNIPPLVIIIFWSTAVILKLPRVDRPIEWLDAFVLSNRGFWVPRPQTRDSFGTYAAVLGVGVVIAGVVAWWRTRRFDATGEPHHRTAWAVAILAVVALVGYVALGGPVLLSIPERVNRRITGGTAVGPEYAALLAGLVVYTASHIAEIVRGSILAVARGQTDAASALGLTSFQRLRYVVLPQAFRVATPALGNQFLNLTKNTSLAVAIGYAELMRVTQIVIGNGNPAPQAIAVLMAIYLFFSLTITAMTNAANRRLQRSSG